MKNIWKPTDHVYSYDEKRAALIDLVNEAVAEREAFYPGAPSPFAGPAFEAIDFQTYYQDALIDALTRTDALSVLGRIFETEVA